jgi:hypothetical protein
VRRCEPGLRACRFPHPSKSVRGWGHGMNEIDCRIATAASPARRSQRCAGVRCTRTLDRRTASTPAPHRASHHAPRSPHAPAPETDGCLQNPWHLLQYSLESCAWAKFVTRLSYVSRTKSCRRMFPPPPHPTANCAEVSLFTAEPGTTTSARHAATPSLVSRPALIALVATAGSGPAVPGSARRTNLSPPGVPNCRICQPLL